MRTKTKLPLQVQNVKRITLAKGRHLVRQFKSMDNFEKITVVGIILCMFVLLFFPLMKISPNTTNVTISYGFLLSWAFIKSFILIFGSLLLSLLWFTHRKIQVLGVENLGFQGNKYLPIFLLLALCLGSFISMGESLQLLANYTTVISLTTSYYLVQILLVILLAFCLFMLFSSSQKFQGHIVGYHGRRSPAVQAGESKGLFDEVSHEDR